MKVGLEPVCRGEISSNNQIPITFQISRIVQDLDLLADYDILAIKEYKSTNLTYF